MLRQLVLALILIHHSSLRGLVELLRDSLIKGRPAKSHLIRFVPKLGRFDTGHQCRELAQKTAECRDGQHRPESPQGDHASAIVLDDVVVHRSIMAAV